MFSRRTFARVARDPIAACLTAAFVAGGVNAATAAAGGLEALQAEALRTARLPAFLQALRADATGTRAQAAHPRAAPAATAAAAVTSCADDGGFDTLRHAVLTADPSDTIDLSALACSKITLQSGAIAVTVSDLKIIGPGSGALTIDANHASRVFDHTGVGTLSLSGLTVSNGTEAADNALGGCIYSKGSLALDGAVVTSCAAVGQTAAVGGAITALGSLDMKSSTISNSSAEAQVGQDMTLNAAGGAAFVAHGISMTSSIVSGNSVQAPTGKTEGGAFYTTSLTAKYSTLTGNKALAAGTKTSGGIAGAVFSTKLLLRGSTVDHNEADVAAAVYTRYYDASSYASVLQSTISTNNARLAFGGIVAQATLNIANSTIAFNTAGSYGGPAVGIGQSAAGTIESTIIADNVPLDLDGGGAIAGANNLIKIAGQNVTVPGGTFTLDPQLGPLQFNGGRTRTHALLSGSPAIDQGDDAAAVATDQRGLTYRRVVGSKADIGAFEVDDDHIFGDALEATPPLL